MSARSTAPLRVAFGLTGAVSALVAPLRKAVGGETWTPTRPLGGWLATYGKVLPDGSVVETQDRQGHVFEAARTVGQIDFAPYLQRGVWNDTHTPGAVGKPTSLEHHDGTTELSKAHGKVGWWTEGHLWDRQDPRSWTLFGAYEPTSADLDRADYYWSLATMLKSVPRPLGFSAEGHMLLSPCRKRIVWAQVTKNAVCEMPQNPDAIAMPLALAGDARLDLDMLGRSPCDTCTCPPGARCATRPTLALAKAARRQQDTAAIEPEAANNTLSGTNREADPHETDAETDDHMVELICRTYLVPRDAAVRWVRQFRSTQEQR